MKAKTVILSVGLASAITGGSIYGAYQYSLSHQDPIKVMPVASANMYYYDSGSEQTLDGTVYSKDTQSVELKKDFSLTKVYVKQGDEVKVGDPLLEYDMTLPELKREMEQINKQSLELTLKKQEKQLEKIKANPNSASVITSGDGSSDDDAGDSGDEMTQSADVIEDGSSAAPSAAAPAGEADPQTQTQSGAQSQASASEELADDGQSNAETDPAGGNGASDGALIEEDAEGGGSGQTPQTEGTEGTEGLIDEDAGGENTQVSELPNSLILAVTEFRSIENRLRIQYNEDPTSLSQEEITKALNLFRTELSDTPSADNGTVVWLQPDVFGNDRQVNLYPVSGAVNAALEQSFPDASRQKEQLSRAYANVLYDNLVCRMNQLNAALAAAGVTADTADSALIRGMKDQIVSAADAYYAFSREWPVVARQLMEQVGYTQNDIDLVYSTYYQNALTAYVGVNGDITDPTDGVLSKLAARLNDLETVEETESESQLEPETDIPDMDGGDLGDGEDTSGLSQDEINEMIRDQESQIKETKLQIRETELKIRKYNRTLEGQIVRATMDGVVKSAGSVGDTAGTDDGFIVITGAAGMYVSVNVNEMKRDSVQIGDTVTGTSYETSVTFTGTVTEVSEYPADTQDGYYGFYYGGDSDNPNASFYPVIAYIEDTTDLTEGEASVQIVSSSQEEAGSIYLQNYFVRSDANGKSYVYVQGEDSLLEKRYVTTGGSLWGSGVEIKSGLTTEDYIAFPYGKKVKEGAKTTQVDSLDDGTMYYG